jgi:hypothetical protein
MSLELTSDYSPPGLIRQALSNVIVTPDVLSVTGFKRDKDYQ